MVVLYGIFLLLVAQGAAIPVLLNSDQHELTFQADLSGRCPPGYSQPDNSNWPYCYQVNSDFKTSKDAASQCRASNGVLASVPSSYVNSFIYYLATQVDATSVWLGAECFNGDKTTCMNNDGSKFNYSNFKTGQPSANENCVYLSASGRDGQEWSTFDCQQRFSYACEVAAGTSGQPTTTAPPARNLTCPLYYSEYQGMCYRYVSARSTAVNDDSTHCRSVPGGNLATISSSGLNTFLATKITDDGDWLAFGLRCLNVTMNGDQSSCKWDDGTPYGWNAFKQDHPLLSPGFSGSGCCAFAEGSWTNCFSCDQQPFNAYFCQAPKQ